MVRLEARCPEGTQTFTPNLPHRKPPSAYTLHKSATFIHEHLSKGASVVVISAADAGYGAVFVLAYFIEYGEMSLANAYSLLSLRYEALLMPPRTWLAQLSAAYNLPYSYDDLWGPYFLRSLIADTKQQISPILEGLWLGGLRALHEPHLAANLGIQAVLRLDDLPREIGQWSADYLLCDLPMADARPLAAERLRQGLDFMHEQLEAGRPLLVHCEMGISRSVTFVLAYLVAYHHLSLRESCQLIIQRRPSAQPHPILLASLNNFFGWGYDEEHAEQICLWGENVALQEGDL